MRWYFLFLASSLFFTPLFTQTANSVELSACYRATRAHAALAAQPALLEQQRALRSAQIEAGRLPDISVNGRATFQSENVDLGIDNPLFQSPNLPLFQYRISADAAYTVYDGGYRNALLEQENAAARVRSQSVETALYQLRERVNQPFFGVLLLRQKIALLESSKDELKQRITSLQGAVAAGARLKGDVDRLNIQVLRLESEIEQAHRAIRGMLDVLEQLTGQTYPDGVQLILPTTPEILPADIKRPELLGFQLQQEQTLHAEALLDARLKPKVGAFAQLGLGAPNPLNFFDDNLSPFGIVGVQVAWKIADWQHTRREKQWIEVQRQGIEVEKNYFLQQLNRLDGKYREDLAAIEAALRSQEAIAAMQESIRRESAAQLDQGVRTATDYLSDSNAILQTRLQLETLRLQARQLYIDFLTLKGLL